MRSFIRCARTYLCALLKILHFLFIETEFSSVISLTGFNMNYRREMPILSRSSFWERQQSNVRE